VTTAQLTIVCVTVVVLAVLLSPSAPRLAGRPPSRPPGVPGPAAGSTIAALISGGDLVHGTYVDGDEQVLVLEDAAVVSGSDRQAMGGRVRVQRRHVIWTQEL
jgi:hypothetical protein